MQNLAFLTGEKKLAEALETKDNVEIIYSTVVNNYLTKDGAISGLELRNDDPHLLRC